MTVIFLVLGILTLALASLAALGLYGFSGAMNALADPAMVIHAPSRVVAGPPTEREQRAPTRDNVLRPAPAFGQ